jgi:hypothetical protein
VSLRARQLDSLREIFAARCATESRGSCTDGGIYLFKASSADAAVRATDLTLMATIPSRKSMRAGSPWIFMDGARPTTL